MPANSKVCICLVPGGRLQLPTLGLGNLRSMQLSYPGIMWERPDSNQHCSPCGNGFTDRCSTAVATALPNVSIFLQISCQTRVVGIKKPPNLGFFSLRGLRLEVKLRCMLWFETYVRFHICLNPTSLLVPVASYHSLPLIEQLPPSTPLA